MKKQTGRFNLKQVLALVLFAASFTALEAGAQAQDPTAATLKVGTECMGFIVTASGAVTGPLLHLPDDEGLSDYPLPAGAHGVSVPLETLVDLGLNPRIEFGVALTPDAIRKALNQPGMQLTDLQPNPEHGCSAGSGAFETYLKNQVQQVNAAGQKNHPDFWIDAIQWTPPLTRGQSAVTYGIDMALLRHRGADAPDVRIVFKKKN